MMRGFQISLKTAVMLGKDISNSVMLWLTSAPMNHVPILKANRKIGAIVKGLVIQTQAIVTARFTRKKIAVGAAISI